MNPAWIAYAFPIGSLFASTLIGLSFGMSGLGGPWILGAAINGLGMWSKPTMLGGYYLWNGCSLGI